MNDKHGGAPQPIANSPSNFGARPAPSAPPVTPISGGPSTLGQRPGSVSGTFSGASGMTSTNFGGTSSSNANRPGNGVNQTGNGANRPGPANFGARRPEMNNKTVSQGMNGAINSADMRGASMNGATQNGANNPMGPNSEGLNRPMTKAAAPIVKGKKPVNKKLVIGIACGVVALVLIVGVAAVAMLMLNKSDPVAKAMDKLISGGLPTNLSVRADANAQFSGDDSENIVSHFNISATSSMMPATLTNETNATITMGGRNMDDTTFQISEIYAGEGNLFVMIDGLGSAMENYMDALEYTQSETVSSGEECVDEFGDPIECADAEPETTALDDESAVDEETLTEDGEAVDDLEAETADPRIETDEAVDEATELDETADGTENGIMTISEDDSENSSEATDMMSNMLMQFFIGIAQGIDGKWIKIDSDGSAASSTTMGTNTDDGTTEEDEVVDAVDGTDTTDETEGLVEEDDTTQGMTIEPTDMLDNLNVSSSSTGGVNLTCDIALMQKIRDNSGTVAEIYRNNPFVDGSDENVSLSKKSYPVYRIVIDEEKYAGFIEAVQSKGLLNDYMKCSGSTINDINNLPSQMPTVYTEVDDNSNFTRFYFATTTNGTTLTVNFDLGYPANINVKEPQNYVTVQEAFQQIMMDMMTESGLGNIGVLDGLEEGAVTTIDTTTE